MRSGTLSARRTLTAALFLSAGIAAADTLVLRDGRRVEGRLAGVSGDVIEFERTGWNQRLERYDRSDVERIEIDARRPDRDEGRGGQRDDQGQGDRDHGYSPGGRPAGLRERTVSVSARSPWSDAGIQVRQGQEVYFEAHGKVRWGKDRNDDAGGENHSPRNPGRPIPDRPAAALIGRLNNDDPFFIGDENRPIRMRSSGRLQLGINDDYLLDNTGEFRVTIYY
jgi:hypothetical protein